MKTEKNLVLLSGLLCDKTVWQDIEKNLEDIVNIYIVSFKGCDSIESMAKKVLDLVPMEFSLIGHSMGARVAVEIMNIAPRRVEKLALFNTGIHTVSPKEIEGRQKLLDIAENEGMKSLMESWLPPMMSKEGLKNKELMEKLESMVLSYSVKDYFKQIYALINRPNAQEILSSINIPTLLLSGTEDKWSPISQHEEMQKYIKNSKLEIIKDAGHMAPCEFPNEVSSVIRKWFLNHE